LPNACQLIKLVKKRIDLLFKPIGTSKGLCMAAIAWY